MKVVIAPDSFKGSATAKELCSAIAKGIRSVMPEAELLELPLADGGEGILDNLVHATGGKRIEAAATDPLGRAMTAAYGVLGDGETVIIEMAQASGLPLLTAEERRPLLTSSRGTGELIKHALDQGYRKFIIGLGGSATNDGGSGMLRALGLQLQDAQGQPLAEGGGALSKLAELDDSGLDSRLAESRVTIASDVTNTLCGPQGASAIFGPQKGATPEMVAVLDEGLRKFAEQIHAIRGIDVLTLTGGGAAGGMGAGIAGFMNAVVRPGIEVVMEASGFAAAAKDADYIITGEGKLDEQTLSGKVAAGVCGAAGPLGVPVIILCGMRGLSIGELSQLGKASAFSIVPGPCTLEEAIAHTTEWTEAAAAQLFSLLKNSS
ncbi:glycerate kinase [Paenibacillus lignilyticus]|uniref:Glycerate kinase n=1 Tax=Paenibacillus lignilyticus TaxID=1172615 RepID=A0ABS5CG16_9BACL|nr:glycerate kinase [Paenibacillus lignilyticus]MBP3964794.1 glycerate kinase [Paenibacillus lignilyticus]